MKTTVEYHGNSFQVTRDNGQWSIFPTVLNSIVEMKLRCLAAKKETSSDGKVIVKHKGMEHDGFAVTIGKDDVAIEPLPFCSREVIKVLDLAVAQIYKESKNMASFNPNDPSIQAIRQRMVPGDKVRDLPQYPADDIKQGQKYAIALPRWISGNCDQQMYDIAIAIEDMKGEGGVVFRPHIMMGDSSQSVKGPLSEIHAQLAVKKIHEQMDKELSNITASCVARTRPIKSEFRLLTDWQTEILEIMEANGVSDENIGKVLDLL